MGAEQDILAQFIGTTYGLAKQLDDQIIGSSSSLQKRSDDMKKVLTEVVTGSPQLPPQNQPQVFQQPQQAQQVVIKPPEDGQLWLTFEDRDEIYNTLDDIKETLKIILKRLENIETPSIISTKRK